MLELRFGPFMLCCKASGRLMFSCLCGLFQLRTATASNARGDGPGNSCWSPFDLRSRGRGHLVSLYVLQIIVLPRLDFIRTTF